jgi:hypothetical protein
MNAQDILDLKKELDAHYEAIKLDNAEVVIKKTFHDIPLNEFREITKELELKVDSLTTGSTYLYAHIGSTINPGVYITLLSEKVKTDVSLFVQA